MKEEEKNDMATVTQTQGAKNAGMAERSYTFQTQPKPVASRRRPMYTAAMNTTAAPGEVANIMYDRRVVRGNTYAAQVVPANAVEDAQTAAGGGGAGTRRAAGAQGGKSMTRSKVDMPGPDADVSAVEGRRHADVQTDQYLEVLEDVIPEHDNATQTDAFNDRPPTPMFLQAKTGIDTSTQVEDGELFDFDLEVAPLLEVLVGKTIEQSFTEVLEEEELRAMRDHQEYFEQVRTAELVATQRMEAEERRKAAENARRAKQEEERIAREKLVRDKISSVQLARGYLTGVFNVVFDKLYEDGTFYDPSVKEVEDDFLPLLTAMVTDKVTAKEVSREMVRKIIREAVGNAKRTSTTATSAAGSSSSAMKTTDEVSAPDCARRVAEARSIADAVPTLLLEPSTGLVPAEEVSAVQAELAAEAQGVADAATERKKAKAAAALAEMEEKAAASEEEAKAAALAAEECQSEMMAALTSTSDATADADADADAEAPTAAADEAGTDAAATSGDDSAAAAAGDETSTTAAAASGTDITVLESKFNVLKAEADDKLSVSAEARAALERAREDLATVSDELPAPISDESTLQTLMTKGACSDADARDVLAMLELGAAAYTRLSSVVEAVQA